MDNYIAINEQAQGVASRRRLRPPSAGRSAQRSSPCSRGIRARKGDGTIVRSLIFGVIYIHILSISEHLLAISRFLDCLDREIKISTISW